MSYFRIRNKIANSIIIFGLIGLAIWKIVDEIDKMKNNLAGCTEDIKTQFTSNAAIINYTSRMKELLKNKYPTYYINDIWFMSVEKDGCKMESLIRGSRAGNDTETISDIFFIDLNKGQIIVQSEDAIKILENYGTIIELK